MGNEAPVSISVLWYAAMLISMMELEIPPKTRCGQIYSKTEERERERERERDRDRERDTHKTGPKNCKFNLINRN